MSLTLSRTALTLATLAASALAPSVAHSATLVTTSITCSAVPTTQAFRAFGDLADYAAAPGGTFESEAGGWTFSNAGIVAGNETAGITAGTHALRLGLSAKGGDAVATSPELCVSQLNPSFRYMVRAAGVASKTSLTTTVSYRSLKDPTKTTSETKTTGLTYGTVWLPSAVSPLATLLPWKKIDGDLAVRISFRVPAKDLAAGGLLVDSLLVDPIKRS